MNIQQLEKEKSKSTVTKKKKKERGLNDIAVFTLFKIAGAEACL